MPWRRFHAISSAAGAPSSEALVGALVLIADAKNVEVPVSRNAYALLELREQLVNSVESRVGKASAGR